MIEDQLAAMIPHPDGSPPTPEWWTGVKEVLRGIYDAAYDDGYNAALEETEKRIKAFIDDGGLVEDR